MELEQSVYFPPFCLDLHRACLWNDTERVALIPKEFAMLAYLATHPDRLVSYKELLRAVWGDIRVSHGVFKVHLCRIRRVLHDSAAHPRFIETVPRQGYRFIAPLGLAHVPVVLRHDRPRELSSVLHDLQSVLALADLEEHFAQVNEWLKDIVQKVRSLAAGSQRPLPYAA